MMIVLLAMLAPSAARDAAEAQDQAEADTDTDTEPLRPDRTALGLGATIGRDTLGGGVRVRTATGWSTDLTVGGSYANTAGAAGLGAFPGDIRTTRVGGNLGAALRIPVAAAERQDLLLVPTVDGALSRLEQERTSLTDGSAETTVTRNTSVGGGLGLAVDHWLAQRVSLTGAVGAELISWSRIRFDDERSQVTLTSGFVPTAHVGLYAFW